MTSLNVPVAVRFSPFIFPLRFKANYSHKPFDGHRSCFADRSRKVTLAHERNLRRMACNPLMIGIFGPAVIAPDIGNTSKGKPA
jgi:hypothetical protein